MSRVASVAQLALLLCLTFSTSARAQENLRLAEDAIKVGLIYNFLHYTAWPDDALDAGSYTVCFYGDDPFAGRLSLMAERSVNQRAIRIEHLSNDSEARACSVVFVNATERERWPRLREALGDSCVLTVSDFEGFAAAGGMIEFTAQRNRIGLRINADAVSAARLSVQDRLLRLAELSRAQR